MQIADGIAMLDISAPVLGKVDTVHPTLLWDEQTVLLVDTGFPRQLEQVREAVNKAGVMFEELNVILMTHQDIDHIGNLPDLVSGAVRSIQVLAHELEQPYIQGERRLIKVTDEALAGIDHLPAEVPLAWRQALKAMLEHPPKAKVDRTIGNGDVLPYCGGIVVIGTPGHTPGHISLYHQRSKTLIAGDALVVANGQLHGSIPAQTWDSEMAKRSLGELAKYDIEQVICYHGGWFAGNVNRRIAELAEM